MDRPNEDPETGIHYGVIRQNSLADWVLDEIFQNGDNLSYDEAREEFEKDLRRKYFGKNAGIFEEKLEAWNDQYEENEDTYRYASDGITVQTSGGGNLWVFKSPTIVLTRQCSPCYPNAGNLDETENGYLKTYALPEDWLRKEDT